MGNYGNSRGRNLGKKYKKLRGGEVATPEAQAAADKFLTWFGRLYGYIREHLIDPHNMDEDVYHDAALLIYESIALKDLVIKGKTRGYYLRVYHTALLKMRKDRDAYDRRVLSLTALENENLGEDWIDYSHADLSALRKLAAPEDQYAEWETATDTLRGEMLEFVRRHYDPADCSIFEIYMELQPSITYKSMAEMLGIPQQRVWQTVRDIKAELAHWFEARKDFLLS